MKFKDRVKLTWGKIKSKFRKEEEAEAETITFMQTEDIPQNPDDSRTTQEYVDWMNGNLESGNREIPENPQENAECCPDETACECEKTDAAEQTDITADEEAPEESCCKETAEPEECGCAPTDNPETEE